MNKQLVALVSISALAYLGFNLFRKYQQESKAVINLGPFEFTTPRNEWVEDIADRLQKNTKINILIDGIEIIFPPLPALPPSKIGVIYVTPKPKKYTYKTLTQNQILAIAKEVNSKIRNIKVEPIDSQYKKIIIPKITIPIY